MTNYDVTPEELELGESVDWTRRAWPRACAYYDIPGEWTLTIKGTDEDFIRAHNALFAAGFDVRDEDELYVREDDKDDD